AGSAVQILFVSLVLFPKSPVPFSGAGSDDSNLDPGFALPVESHTVHSPGSLPDKAHPRPGLTHVSNVYKLKWPLKKRHGCVTDCPTLYSPHIIKLKIQLSSLAFV